jgi:hypothetical protein
MNTEKEKPENHVEVAVVTTSGSWPDEGFEGTPSNQKVKIVLKKAVDKLHIVSTEKWVAKVNGREVNPDLSYEENHLSGKITIDYGPREGGGGK